MEKAIHPITQVMPLYLIIQITDYTYVYTVFLSQLQLLILCTMSIIYITCTTPALLSALPRCIHSCSIYLIEVYSFHSNHTLHNILYIP